MMQRTELPFKAHCKSEGEGQSEFKKVDLEERFQLYRQIAEQLWSVERLQGGSV